MKVLKLKSNPLNGKSHINFIHNIIEGLAVRLNFISNDGKIQIRKVRELIIKQAHIEQLNISKKDIKRLEYPDKCQIPTNTGKILEKVAAQMLKFRGTWSSGIMPIETPSSFLIHYTLLQLEFLCALLQEPELNPNLVLKLDAIHHTSLEIQKFDNLYNNDANNLL